MTFLPIVDRELRVAARRKSTHRLRLWTTFGAAVAASMFLVFAFFMSAFLGGAGARTAGKMMFDLLAFYIFGLCLLAGIILAGDCLSEEKREGTLGLLFLTDLKGYDVALGKFSGVWLPAFYGLVACLPVLAFPMMMGGVTWDEFWRMALALVNTLFFSMAAGLCVSACSRQMTRAMSATLALLTCVVLICVLIDQTTQWLWTGPAWWRWILPSPLHPFINGFADNYKARGGPAIYWGTLTASHLAGWLLVAAAAVFLPRYWQDKPRETRFAWAAKRADSPTANPRAPRARRRDRKLLDPNPIVWLAMPGRGLTRGVWAIVAIYLVFVIIQFVLVINDSNGSGILASVMTNYVTRIAEFGLKLAAAEQACRFFMEARQNGSLELLLCTPVPERDIVSGQWAVMRKLLVWPSLIIFFAWLAVSIMLMATVGLETVIFSTFGVYQQIKFVMDIAAVGWFGMWLALVVKKPNHALMYTILFVLVLPILASCVPDVFIDIFFIFWGGMKVQTSIHKLVESQVKAPAPGSMAPDAPQAGVG